MEDYKEEFCEQEDEIDIKFVEVSAKEGTNINSLFDEISVKLLERHNKALGLKKGAKVMPNDPA